MTDSRDGQVVTFYSYKGGTGRTMALANVAWILAANGKRVLVVDWDLESPGLNRFFSPFVDAAAFASTGGVIDLIRDYEWATTRNTDRDDRWHEQFARVHKHTFSLNWPNFPDGGQLDFLAAGRQDRNYVELLASLNWDNFYERLGGGQFFDALRADMRRHYDYTLIDSRTGFSDIADICTIHLPDTLVTCFTLSEQGIEGAAQVARDVQHRYHSRNIRILPVPMRVDPAEKQKADSGRLVAKQRFAGLPVSASDEERDSYWATISVPYQAYYAYEETLATFGDTPGSSTSLLASYEAITAHITNGEVTALPAMPEVVRARVNAKFVRQPTAATAAVTLRYAPQDQVWAEWIEHVLVSAGIQVTDAHGAEARTGPGAATPLTIVSQANRAEEASVIGAQGNLRPSLAVYIPDVLALPNVSNANSFRLGGQSSATAAAGLLRLLGYPEVSADPIVAGGPRFPGIEPTVFNVPARNHRFTGREDDLRTVRSQLRSGRSAVVLSGSVPVTLQGLGGVGKTQVALEYAYRFRHSYDIVWWIDAGLPQFIESGLADLSVQIGLPAQVGVAENTRAVLQALQRGEPYAHWLIILDNAEDVELVKLYLPQGTGHVLITSRNTAWVDRARPVPIDVFERRDSIAHLRQRVPLIKDDEAARIAEALGDLPIAVAAAGAWLFETGTSVDDYLQQIEEHGPRVLGAPESGFEGRVEAIWDLSLLRLQERSPAAYRLLQFCSVLAPEIALDLVYSDELANALLPVDPSVSERLVRGSLVQAINRLALLRIDQLGERGPGGERLPGEPTGRGGQIVVHRLLQHVVRSRMSTAELEETQHQVHLMLAASRPRSEVDDPDTWARYRLLWPHLEISGAVSCLDEPVRQLLIDRVRYMWFLGDLVPGLELALRIEAAWKELLDDETDPTDHQALRRQMLHLRFNLANILRALGRFEESWQLSEAVVAEQRTLLGPEHPHTLMSTGGLAGDLRGLGRYEDALRLDELTYAAWADSFGDDHPRTLTALSNLAVSNRLMGDFRKAYDRDVQVHARRQVVLRENHPNTLQAAGNIGRDLRDAGEFNRSIEILEDVVEKYAQTWGPDTRGALVAQANLAVSLRKAGRAIDAVEILDRAYEQLHDSFGADSPDTLSARLSRAMNLLALHQSNRAYDELLSVRAAYEHGLGAEHPQTLACVNNLALAARAIHESELAVDLAREATESLERTLRDDHPRVLGARLNLAICSAEAGDQTTAIEALQGVSERMAKVLGPDHPDTLRCRYNESTILRQFTGAPTTDQDAKVVELLTRRLGPSHPVVHSITAGRLLHKIIDPHPF